METPEFLDNKYQDLAGSKPVERAVQKAKRDGEKVPHERAERVGAYIDRLEDIIKDERGFSLLKYKILEKYVTKPEDIPESYWKAQEEELRRRGEGGDWDAASDEQKQTVRNIHAEAVLNDQRSSLEQWVDYFGSSDSDSIPRELKYWIFRSVINLQELVKKKEAEKEYIEFPKRSKGTVKPFPDINYEALAYVVDAVIKKLKGENIEFEDDIQPDERESFNRFLAKEDFAKLYAWANELMTPIPAHLLPITEGVWVKYNQGSEPANLVQTIRGKGTGWCTAGLNTAKTQLEGGDFYVYYTLDDNKEPKIPRLAIRMEGHDKIAEDPRGIAYKQNTDPYMDPILEQKLNEFGPIGEAYKKKSANMKLLNQIYTATKSGQALSKNELIFLYEIEAPIEGFGYQKNPRIKELRDKRNPKEDAPIVLGCAPEEIAWNQSEISATTKSYIGPLFDGIFQKKFEHIYSSFPEGIIKQFEVMTGGKFAEEYEEDFKKAKRNISDFAKSDLLHSKDFEEYVKKHPTPESADLIRLSVKDLGFPSGATTDEIYAKATEYGLELCPPDVGPALRLAYDGTEYLLIATKQILDRNRRPNVFDLTSDGHGLWLSADNAYPTDRWGASPRFVFRLRKLDTKKL